MSPTTRKLCGAVMTIVLGAACSERLDKDTSRTEAIETEALTSTRGQERTEGTQSTIKHGFVRNIERLTEANRDFRRVIYTAPHLQLVLMTIPPGDHIGAETHDVDQFFRVESGTGEVIIGSARSQVGPGSAIVVPGGTRHDVVAHGDAPLELYTIYGPPNHRDGVVHHTRADAERDDEKFDGKTTE